MFSSGSFFIIASFLLNLTLPTTVDIRISAAPHDITASAYQMEYSQTALGGIASDSDTYSSQDCIVAGSAATETQASDSYSTSNAMDSSIIAPNSKADGSWALY